jgi:hypothetical protein
LPQPSQSRVPDVPGGFRDPGNKRTRNGVFALCWIVASLASYALYFHVQDLPDAADADLSYRSERLPSSRNGVTHLNEAAQSLEYPDDYAESADRIDLTIIGVEWDAAWVSKLLVSNQVALAQRERAFRSDAMQLRLISNYGEKKALSDWLMLAKLAALAARSDALGGESERALHSVLVLAHFGAWLRENEGLRASRDPFARTVIESLLTLSPSVYSVKRNVLGDYWADLAERSIRIYQQTGRVSESLVSAVQGMVALKAFEGRLGRMRKGSGTTVNRVMQS